MVMVPYYLWLLVVIEPWCFNVSQRSSLTSWPGPCYYYLKWYFILKCYIFKITKFCSFFFEWRPVQLIRIAPLVHYIEQMAKRSVHSVSREGRCTALCVWCELLHWLTWALNESTFSFAVLLRPLRTRRKGSEPGTRVLQQLLLHLHLSWWLRGRGRWREALFGAEVHFEHPEVVLRERRRGRVE